MFLEKTIPKIGVVDPLVGWLKLRALYKNNMHLLETVIEDDEQDLSGNFQESDVMAYLHNQEIKQDLARLQVAYENLGLRLGECVPEVWVRELPKLDKQIFLWRFENKLRYSEIANRVELRPDDVRHVFQKSLHKVMKKAGGE